MKVFYIFCLLSFLQACSPADKKSAMDEIPSQVLARVNGKDITVHQVNYLLSQQKGMPPSSQGAIQEALDFLVNQELFIQKSIDLRLDRDPVILQRLEMSRRDVLASAYIEWLKKDFPKDIQDGAIEKYYTENKSFFLGRAIYDAEIIEVHNLNDDKLSLVNKIKNTTSLKLILRKNNINFIATEKKISTEELPEKYREKISRSNKGDLLFFDLEKGCVFYHIIDFKAAPLSIEDARKKISLYLSYRNTEDFENYLKNIKNKINQESIITYSEKRKK